MTCRSRALQWPGRSAAGDSGIRGSGSAVVPRVRHYGVTWVPRHYRRYWRSSLRRSSHLRMGAFRIRTRPTDLGATAGPARPGIGRRSTTTTKTTMSQGRNTTAISPRSLAAIVAAIVNRNFRKSTGDYDEDYDGRSGTRIDYERDHDSLMERASALSTNLGNWIFLVGEALAEVHVAARGLLQEPLDIGYSSDPRSYPAPAPTLRCPHT